MLGIRDGKDAALDLVFCTHAFSPFGIDSFGHLCQDREPLDLALGFDLHGSRIIA
jgi:hypothetical protein